MAKNRAAQELGKLGGKARAAALTPERKQEIAAAAGKASSEARTPEQRSEIARKAVQARWAKRKAGRNSTT